MKAGLLIFLIFHTFFNAADVRSMMETGKVVPDIIDQVPPAVLEAKFGNVVASMGN